MSLKKQTKEWEVSFSFFFQKNEVSHKQLQVFTSDQQTQSFDSQPKLTEESTDKAETKNTKTKNQLFTRTREDRGDTSLNDGQQ